MSESSVSPERSGEIHLSVIIPAFNEVDRIQSSVERVLRFLDSRSYRSEVIIVLDGGRPGAAEAIGRAAGCRPDVIVVDNGRNRGKGYSIRRGVAAARGEFVLFADADLSLPIENTDRFLAALTEGSDLAVASRTLPDSVERGQRPRLRHSLGRVFNWLVRATVLPGLHDTQCGFKAFKGPIARQLFAAQRIDGFGFDVELLRIAHVRSYLVTEVPVVCEYHPSSSVRQVRHGASMIRDLVRIVWWDWRGRYDERR